MTEEKCFANLSAIIDEIAKQNKWLFISDGEAITPGL